MNDLISIAENRDCMEAMSEFPDKFFDPESSGFTPTMVPSPEDVEFIIADLFCGAGGTTTGFPRDYKLYGNQSDQKKFIGNSVVPHVVKSWCEAMAGACREVRKEAA